MARVPATPPSPPRSLPAAGQPPLPPWPGRRVDLGEGAVFVRRVPETSGGEPALYVHGLGGASTNWTDLGYLLADRFDGAALDLPGFGRSGPPVAGRYPLDVHARAVVAAAERLFDAPVHLLANSLGGAVAVRVAAERPDLVRTLTLVSPALPDLRPRRGGDPRLALLLVPVLGEWLAGRMARASPQARVRRLLAMCYADPSRVHPDRVAEAEEEVLRRTSLDYGDNALVGSLRGLVGAWLTVGARSLWRQAAAVRAPTLLVWGRQDRLVDVAVGRRAQRAMSAARLLVLDDAAHVAQLERPEAVAAAVLDLVQ